MADVSFHAIDAGAVTPESSTTPRRLPSRKRSRSSAADDIDVEVDGHRDASGGDAGGIVGEGGGVGGGPETPTPLLVMPDLIKELIENGSVAPHIIRILRAAHNVTWRDRTGIDPEVEVGTTVATLEPAAPKETAATAGTGAPVQAPVPFLLRAFRRTVPADAGVRSGSGGTATVASINHCIAEPQAIDDWAPLSLLHVVKALRACGVSLRGPTVVIQPTETVTATADGQRYVLSRRMRLRLGESLGVTTSEADLKCKYHVPVTYPGPSQSETLHLALECRRTDGKDGEVLHAARRHGILPARTSVILRAAPVQRNTYAKCEWSSGSDDHALVRVVVRLQFVLPDGVSVAAFHAAVLASPRPRGPSDVPRWIEAVGCRGSAEWRIELEMIPPIHTSGLTQVLFLHHLVRQTLQPTGVCLSRAAFTGLFARHLRSTAARETTDAAYGRWMLAEYCRDADLPLNARSGYPRQPRPFDLVDRYVDRLLGCVATPKADDPRGTDTVIDIYDEPVLRGDRHGSLPDWTRLRRNALAAHGCGANVPMGPGGRGRRRHHHPNVSVPSGGRDVWRRALYGLRLCRDTYGALWHPREVRGALRGDRGPAPTPGRTPVTADGAM